ALAGMTVTTIPYYTHTLETPLSYEGEEVSSTDRNQETFFLPRLGLFGTVDVLPILNLTGGFMGQAQPQFYGVESYLCWDSCWRSSDSDSETVWLGTAWLAGTVTLGNLRFRTTMFVHALGPDTLLSGSRGGFDLSAGFVF
ncbi:MAG: hypothetical protein KC561_02275, partial [Myxococcales bacterium]|nr:hypothetical protein [Myxococcales bacterium]